MIGFDSKEEKPLPTVYHSHSSETSAFVSDSGIILDRNLVEEQIRASLSAYPSVGHNSASSILSESTLAGSGDSTRVSSLIDTYKQEILTNARDLADKDRLKDPKFLTNYEKRIEKHFQQYPDGVPLPFSEEEISEPNTWANNMPKKQGLYDPEYEKDACGVGFVCHIKGQRTYEIVADARGLLCNMTHRGATGADPRDGDGAGVMTGIPHELLSRDVKRNFGIVLTDAGTYAVGNVFMSPEPSILRDSQQKFEEVAESLGLNVICWRPVPVDNSMLGPSSKSKEPAILQAFITMVRGPNDEFDAVKFETLLYIFRKKCTNVLGMKKWFYICSLSSKLIVYKGLLSPVHVYQYFLDLTDSRYKSHFCLVHSRFSTNTFPSWDRAQPMRWCAHNGEINTLRGNKNWMRAREGLLKSAKFEKHLDSMLPIIEEGGSDSAAFDNVLELLVLNGLHTLPEAIMMMVPESWENQPRMDPKKRGFYEYSSCLMEPWDGPALFTFSDGRFVGASLDRNGLRPCRFYITHDDIMVCGSEAGAILVPPEKISSKGRLQPGKMLLVDTTEGRIVDDSELKTSISSTSPFENWTQNIINLESVKSDLTEKGIVIPYEADSTSLAEDRLLQAFGFTIEQLNILIAPMASESKEALGSMGVDTPLACLSRQPRSAFEYFRQLFAQVTNPPMDSIREGIVMSLSCVVGPSGNILDKNANQCKRLRLPSPILSIEDLSAIRNLKKVDSEWDTIDIDITFPKSEGVTGYVAALDRIASEVSHAIYDGYKIAILTDKAVNQDRCSLSTLVALGSIHHHLVRNKLRSKIALIVESGEVREVHHFCVLLGYGADGICPYLTHSTILKLHREGLLRKQITAKSAINNYIKAANHGILKVMSKMGISTLHSYKGAQIFEALGLDQSVISKCFNGTASRVHGIGFDILAIDALTNHECAWPSRETVTIENMPETGDYNWRDGAEEHINTPASIANLQDAVRRKNDSAYAAYAKESYNQIKNCTLRGLLDFKYDAAEPIPIDEVEPWTEIVKRFCTGAMSYGSISMEAHSTLAKAMNKLNGKSNTGEGGEDSIRFEKLPDGTNIRSAIKQVASGRFGVTSNYLANADELQIKMAQGAKPGEGGELPGHKVSEEIAKTRKSTPGVGLISPPPHHDIYSIEDLKQLIFDLKSANPKSRVSVKLVSEVGVGVIASGVAKAIADHIVISGHDGGTGASRWTGIKYAGLPWELGVAETHQTLVLNDLRGRVIIQTDGQIKTGRDVAIACLLGAEEWGFATAPLISMGCIMMRKCHLNTCPVGIATQDPELRKKFEGQPEHVINFFYYIAEELRGIMAKLGFHTIDEMVGRTDYLAVNQAIRNAKTRHLNLTPILTPAFTLRPGAATHNIIKQDHKLDLRIDGGFVKKAERSLEFSKPILIESNVINTDRAVGATLSYEVSKRFGEIGLPDKTIHIKLNGSAGQSLGAFLAPGIFIELEGDANDYVGKGLSGGIIALYPPKESSFKSEENIIVGNVCLYGATGGKAFFSGIAAERFCVRNSGAIAVVEGIGDHGCEYMTRGRTVILGSTGRNFGAGMSGGLAYVLDEFDKFYSLCNIETVDLERICDKEEELWLKETIQEHYDYTGSNVAKRLLDTWEVTVPKFVKVFPREYKAILQKQKEKDLLKEQELNGPAPGEPIPTIQEQHILAKKKQDNSGHEEPSVMDVEDSIGDPELSAKKLESVDKLRGFMKYRKQTDHYRNNRKRINDWKEVQNRLEPEELKVQAARCMDCGVPFCQSDSGCPISNIIPRWNDLVFKDQWQEALDRLLMTNNFPEFTGRVCPAPCEGACTLGIIDLPVSIKSIECAIIDRGFSEGWIIPNPPKSRTGKKIAIIGSGAAGLAAADQLNKAGHNVVVYERNDRIGGLLIYGIPNMKLDKRVVQRRVDLLSAEGIDFVTNAHVGKNIDINQIRADNDIVLLATGATWPRDLPAPNRELDGIHFAMEFLHKNTKSLLDSDLKNGDYLSAKGKNVIVIGGGDTGTDCIGTSLRHGAKSIVNFELLPQPSQGRSKDNPWPQFPKVFKVDYGHDEVTVAHGKDPREYCILTKEFVSDGKGHIKGINTIRVEWTKTTASVGAPPKWEMKQISGSEKFFPADLVLLAMGFLGPEKTLSDALGMKPTPRSTYPTINSKSYRTTIPGVYACGDCRRGQSLIVWAINEGRQAAREIDIALMGSSRLPGPGGIIQRPVEALEGVALAWATDGRTIVI